jgi:alpha-glucosidase (family GH31 glycosyl hydrolase)
MYQVFLCIAADDFPNRSRRRPGCYPRLVLAFRAGIGASILKVVLPFVLFSGCGEHPPGPLPTPAIHTPRWGFRPWISKDISDTDDSYSYVGGFIDRKIPVGVLVLDSPWEVDYNTYEPNPVRYHDFDKLVSDMKAKDVRMVLWTTPMLNLMSYDAEPGGDLYVDQSPQYTEAKQKGYFVDDGALYDWWKGTGGGIDFYNDDARSFWHTLQDRVLRAGISGWKLDFGEEYLTSDPVKTKTGTIPHQQYSEEYYRDYWAYGVQERGPEDFLTMVRAYDVSYEWAPRFYSKKETAPVVWVGDNRRDWIGMADALDETFRSAQAGYVVIGSDLGGYLNVDDHDLSGPAIPFDAEVFLRWIALSGIGPFMQLHSRANFEPWTIPDRPDESVASYTYWASLHDALVGYYYSLAEEAYAGRRGSITTPIGDQASWAGDYRFTVGDAFLVAPLLDGSGARDVVLPSGSRWYDWWDDSMPAMDGGTTVHRDYKAESKKIPLFLKEGSIVPLDGWPAGSGVDATLGAAIGLPASGGALEVLVTPGANASFSLHEADGTAMLSVSGNAPITVSATGESRPILWRVRTDATTKVSVGGTLLAEASSLAALSTTSGWFRAPPYTWVRSDGAPSVSVTIE